MRKGTLENTWKDKYCLSAPFAGDEVPGSRPPEMEGTRLFLELGTEPSFCSSWKRRDAVPRGRHRWHHWGLFVQLFLLTLYAGKWNGDKVQGEGHPQGSLSPPHCAPGMV